MPDDVFHMLVEPTVNRNDLARSYQDKNMLNKLLPNARTPPTLLRNMSGQYLDSSYGRLLKMEVGPILEKRSGDYVIKPSLESAGGRNVRILQLGRGQILLDGVPSTVSDVEQRYLSDFLIQERVRQHEFFAKIHPWSLNTIRAITFFSGNMVHVLSTVMRIGSRGMHVDNYSAGGVCCGVDSAGRLSDFAVDKALATYERHPQTGFTFAGARVPEFSTVLKFVAELHKAMPPHFRLVSWDIAMNESGEPVLIELNLRNQQIDFHQVHNGPLFGDLTDSLLDELHRRDNRDG